MNTQKEITKERWNYILEVLPPLYIGYIDGEPIHDGIACSEPFCMGETSNVFTVCYKKEGKYYETLAEVFSSDNKPIWDSYNYIFSSGNIAKTFKNNNKTNKENKRLSKFVAKTKLTNSEIEYKEIIHINFITLIKNYYEKKVHIFIERFPDYLILIALRAASFEWSDTKKVWERDLTDEAIEAAKNILNSIK
jgi:hypothetical protein